MPTKKQTKKTTTKKTKVNEESEDQFKVYGHELLERVKELIKEGNVKKIIIKNDKGKVLVEIPVNIAMAGGLLAPTAAALGVFAALLSKCTIEVKRK